MRLFIALELGMEVQGKVEATLRTLRRLSPDARWVDPGKTHLTLVFLGSVEEERIPALDAALAPVAAAHLPFRLSFADGGTFGGRARPRVLWVGVGGELEALGSLQAELAATVQRLEIPVEERAYTAHLTLARARQPRGDPGLASCAEKLHGKRLGQLTVGEVVLFQSVTSPQGARYQVQRRWPLAGEKNGRRSDTGSSSE